MKWKKASKATEKMDERQDGAEGIKGKFWVENNQEQISHQFRP
jgi:hypothetical protein